MLSQKRHPQRTEPGAELDLKFQPEQEQEIDSTSTSSRSAKRKHTIYLDETISRKLRLYAAENDAQLSHVVETLIDRYL